MESPPTIGKTLPKPLVWIISLAIGFHFFAIGALYLSASSGPWWAPTFDIGDQIIGPTFAREINMNLTYPYYLENLRMTHNYHFDSNRTEIQDVYFVVRLRNTEGKIIQTLKFPQDHVNPFVRHRQKLLAQDLGNDQPVQPPMQERVPSPLVTVWRISDPGKDNKEIYNLEKIPEHTIPRNQPVFRPSEWSLLVAQAYMRYLCREHGAASAELIRHSRGPIPVIPFEAQFLQNLPNNLPPGTFVEMISNFGEYKVEKQPN
jgi:hypothetical protein